MADECYYFDGGAGCDACDAMSGYYLDAPDGPHPNCNCPVETVMAEIEYEIRNVSWDEGNAHVELEETFDNCGNDGESMSALLLDEDEEEDFDEGLREAAEAAGWSEPAAEALDVSFTLQPNTSGDLTMVVHRYVAHFEGEVWAIHEDGTEEYVGEATGHFEKNVNIDTADVERSSCGDELDRWLPQPDGGSGDSGSDSDEPIV